MFALIGLTIPLLKFARLNKLPSLRRLLIAIHATVFIQVTIGLHVVSTYISAVIVTLHLAFGLLLWALVLSVFFRLNKKYMNEGAQCCA
jgi:heme A synthase